MMSLSRQAQDRANALRRARHKASPEKYRAKKREDYYVSRALHLSHKARWYAKNKHTRYWENSHLIKRYGITAADKWARLFGGQSGHCANPACTATAHNPKVVWSIHHIHDSVPLQWCVCCARCNWASGKFKDDPIILRGMADLNENLTSNGYHTPSLVELVEKAQHF